MDATLLLLQLHLIFPGLRPPLSCRMRCSILHPRSTMGLLLVVVVHSASVQDRDGARQLLEWAMWHLPRLWTNFADAAYRVCPAHIRMHFFDEYAGYSNRSNQLPLTAWWP